MSVLDGLGAYGKNKSVKYRNWQEAKIGSLGKDGYLKHSNPKTQHGCHKNSPNPAAWIVQGYDKTAPRDQVVLTDEWYVSWRISSNMVYFTDEQKENQSGYILAGNSKEAAIKVLGMLKAEIESGNWDAEIEEAFNRPKGRATPATEEN